MDFHWERGNPLLQLAGLWYCLCSKTIAQTLFMGSVFTVNSECLLGVDFYLIGLTVNSFISCFTGALFCTKYLCFSVFCTPVVPTEM